MQKILLPLLTLFLSTTIFSQIYLWRNGEIIDAYDSIDSITFVKPEKISPASILFKINRKSWSYNHPMEDITPDFATKSDTIRLHFFGWSLDNDSRITIKFPESTDSYKRAILT